MLIFSYNPVFGMPGVVSTTPAYLLLKWPIDILMAFLETVSELKE